MASELKINIFVEGIDDKKFISDFISYHFNVSVEKNIFHLEGKDKINTKIELFNSSSASIIQQKTATNKKNILVFDADGEYNNGGFKKRLFELNEIKVKYGINFDTFLFPNNKEDGELEDLLERIFTDDVQPILNCFKNYTDCITKIDPKYSKPNKKGKIFAVAESIVGADNAKGSARDYLNSELWNLEDDAVKPLKDFLSTYFESKPTTT